LGRRGPGMAGHRSLRDRIDLAAILPDSAGVPVVAGIETWASFVGAVAWSRHDGISRCCERGPGAVVGWGDVMGAWGWGSIVDPEQQSEGHPNRRVGELDDGRCRKGQMPVMMIGVVERGRRDGERGWRGRVSGI
jgi:hypothetical protein